MKKTRGRLFDILLAGYFGFGNLGDELIGKAAVDNLLSLGFSRERLAVLSNRPDYTASRLGIKAFDRWRFNDVIRALGMTRALVFPGGGIFQDASSVKSVMYYWFLIRAAILRRAEVGVLAQSVGPLRRRIAKWFTYDALSKCRYVSVRDKASADLLSSKKMSYDITPDPVLGIELAGSLSAGAVLVNLRRTTDGIYEEPVIRTAKLAAASGMRIKYMAMSPEDASYIQKLLDSGRIPRGDIAEPKDAEDFSSAARGAFASAGMRLHFGILSMLSGIPVILSPYDPKVSSFASEWGITLFEKRENSENFDIMPLLTNLKFGDKKKLTEVRPRIVADFEKALTRILGTEELGKHEEQDGN